MCVANIITISLIIIIVIVIVIAIATGESPREAKSGVRNSDQLWFPHKEVSTWGQWRAPTILFALCFDAFKQRVRNAVAWLHADPETQEKMTNAGVLDTPKTQQATA